MNLQLIEPVLLFMFFSVTFAIAVTLVVGVVYTWKSNRTTKAQSLPEGMSRPATKQPEREPC